jgi:hypothetical protein
MIVNSLFCEISLVILFHTVGIGDLYVPFLTNLSGRLERTHLYKIN